MQEIPAEKVRLSRIWRVTTTTCGMLACAGGWFTLDPYFQSLGLNANEYGSPTFEGLLSFAALAKFFEFDGVFYAEALFSARYTYRSAFDFETALASDKDLWNARAALFVENIAEFRQIYRG